MPRDASLRYIPPCLVALKTGSMTIEVGVALTASTIIAEHSTFFEVAKMRAEPWPMTPVFDDHYPRRTRRCLGCLKSQCGLGLRGNDPVTGCYVVRSGCRW